MKTLILLSAIPGSGKSTWARKYQTEHPNTHIVASDDVRERVSGSAQNFTKESLVWQTFLEDLNSFADEPDCTVIADSTNLQNRYRSYYFEQTPAFDRHILVVFNIPFETCLRQNKMRTGTRVVPDKAMRALADEFEIPTQEVIDLYDEYILIGDPFEIK